MDYRKAMWLIRILMLLGVVLAVLVCLPAGMLPISGSLVMVACILCFIAAISIYIVHYRCPHCGTSLSMKLNFSLRIPEQCPECGGKLK